MSITLDQFNTEVALPSQTTNKTYNIFIQSADQQDINYAASMELTAEGQNIDVNPTPFEAYKVPIPIDDISNQTPSVIAAMENTNLTSYDAQRDPIHGAVVNDINTLFNLMNLRGETELMLLEKVNMILQYLQTSAKTSTYASKVIYNSTSANAISGTLYSKFVSNHPTAISAIDIDNTKRDKGGFLISNQGVVDGDGVSIENPRPVFSLLQRSNHTIAESFKDYSCIFARVKNYEYNSSYTTIDHAPVIALHFFKQKTDQTNVDLLYKVTLTLSDNDFLKYHNSENKPTLIAWGADPREFNFSTPRSYDNVIILSKDHITKVENANGEFLDLETMDRDILLTGLNSLILKEVSLEFPSNNVASAHPIQTTLFGFGNIIAGGLPQEFICYKE